MSVRGMKKQWLPYTEQMCNLGRHEWSVARLIELSRGLPIMEVPLEHINMYHLYKSLSLRDMVMHMEAVSRADLQFPIILDEDGDILDGRHRIMKALLAEAPTIKAVRFLKNPLPCRVADE